MRIIFIVDDTIYFLPNWLNQVIKGVNKDNKVVAVTPLITKHSPTLYSYLLNNISKIGLSGILKLGFFTLTLMFRKILFDFHFSNQPITISQVAKINHIKIIPSENVNSNKYLQQLIKAKPDIIISSCSQIFKEEILNLPKVACINRHSALLPSYGGVFPIFRAMLNNEKVMGVTVHFMNKGIDKGKSICQTAFPVSNTDSLFSLYNKAYQTSIETTLEALKVLNKQKKIRIINHFNPSYYSFPTSKDWQKFWKNKLKII